MLQSWPMNKAVKVQRVKTELMYLTKTDLSCTLHTRLLPDHSQYAVPQCKEDWMSLLRISGSTDVLLIIPGAP